MQAGSGSGSDVEVVDSEDADEEGEDEDEDGEEDEGLSWEELEEEAERCTGGARGVGALECWRRRRAEWGAVWGLLCGAAGVQAHPLRGKARLGQPGLSYPDLTQSVGDGVCPPS